jgi:hypothetical protein
MTDQNQKKTGGIGELEREIGKRCQLCAVGTATETRRDPAGAILWLHQFDDGSSVSCEAAELQPWREIVRRSSNRVELKWSGRDLRAVLDGLAESS